MTREEAIKYFKRHLDLYCVDGISREAEEMAIQALSQVPCDDAISRQAVLDLINADWKYEGLEEPVSSLPPVTQKSGNTQKSGKWIFVDKAKEHAHCSECDYGNVDLFDGRPHNYCPNCGAKMVAIQESESDV